MTVNDMVDKLIQKFGVKEAKQYVILWQDEYIGKDDRIFRQEVKRNLNNR